MSWTRSQRNALPCLRERNNLNSSAVTQPANPRLPPPARQARAPPVVLAVQSNRTGPTPAPEHAPLADGVGRAPSGRVAPSKPMSWLSRALPGMCEGHSARPGGLERTPDHVARGSRTPAGADPTPSASPPTPKVGARWVSDEEAEARKPCAPGGRASRDGARPGRSQRPCAARWVGGGAGGGALPRGAGSLGTATHPESQRPAPSLRSVPE